VTSVKVRSARTGDVPAIRELSHLYVGQGRLVPRSAVSYYEGIREFQVAEYHGRIVGCGSLHVYGPDLAEIRTLVVDPASQGHGIGGALLDRLVTMATRIGVRRLFCLTFETDFFARHGFTPMPQGDGEAITPETFAQLLRSHDDDRVPELPFDRLKPNTLGNMRMVRLLPAPADDAQDSITITFEFPGADAADEAQLLV
jgi:amino-acid N-acetyltransferase